MQNNIDRIISMHTFDRNVTHHWIIFYHLLICYRFSLDWLGLGLILLTMWLARMWQRKTSTGHLRNGCITGSCSTHRYKSDPVLQETMTKMKKRMISIRNPRNVILTVGKKVALSTNDPRKANYDVLMHFYQITWILKK